MKLILQRDDESTVEIKEIQTLNIDSDVLFFFVRALMRERDIEEIEHKLSSKTGKDVVVLDGKFHGKIMGC